MIENLEKLNPYEIENELKTYQKKTLDYLLKDGKNYEEIAQLWLTSKGSEINKPFGGESKKSIFWDNLKEEFKKFICDDNAYIEEKKQLNEKVFSNKILMTTISSAIGSTLGLSTAVLFPIITILLISVLKIGINAFCNI